MSFVLVSAGIAAAGTAYTISSGISKQNQAKRLAAANVRPDYEVQPQFQQNVNIAGQNAQAGLGPAQVAYYNTMANRGLTTGTNAILAGGGDVDNLARLYDAFSGGMTQEAAQDEALRNQHINTFINANKELAGQKTQQWALNEYEPYKDTAQLASQLKAGGQADIQTGIGEGIAAGSAYSTSKLYGDNVNNKVGTLPQTAPLLDSGGTPGTGLDGNGQIVTPGSSFSPDIFSTPGGQASLNSMLKKNPYSPDMQNFINLFNKPASGEVTTARY